MVGKQITRPAASVPTIEETEAALHKIAPHRSDEAAAALKTLAEQVIALVSTLDRSMVVSHYLAKLELVCNGPNSFVLKITDQNCGINTERLSEEILASHRANAANYGKRARSIEIPFEEPVPRRYSGDEGMHDGDG